MKRLSVGAAALLAVLSSSAAIEETPMGAMRLRGYVGDRLESCIRNHLAQTDVSYLTDYFSWRTEHGWWHTEFWGKFMHSAVPLGAYARDPALTAKIERGVGAILAAQLPDGYIGNYAPEIREGNGWDVWGIKYTLLGLLHHYDATKSERTLAAAKRLGDYLVAHFSPGKKGVLPLHKIGCYRGLPSCSVLEPVVWLYRRTNDRRYLEFASYIVREMDADAADDGCELIRAALAGVDMAARPTGEPEGAKGGLKAYEMMSCYQGLLEYYEVTGDRRCLDAARASAENIARTENNIAGGSCTCEHWYSGTANQTRAYRRTMETCVLTTWMRLCEKLFTLTGEAKWAEELERTFYNAYLASMSKDGSVFSMYHPLNGFRHCGEPHCRTHTNCCDANGPRGFVAFLQTVFTSAPGEIRVNQYASGTFEVPFAAAEGGKVPFEVFTRYPQEDNAMIRYRGAKPLEFAFRLRIPSWSAKTRVGERYGSASWYWSKDEDLRPDVKPGDYYEIRRTWQPGDTVVVGFDMSVRAHELNDHVAFTRGPVVLCRDLRFGDGDIGEMIRRPFPRKDGLPAFTLLDSENSDMWIVVGTTLPLGMHFDNPEKQPRAQQVRFCDYASAGNDWTPKSGYRTWFPLENWPDYMK